MSRSDRISLAAFAIMIVLSVAVALWVRYLRRNVVSSPRLFRSASVGCLHLFGCFVLLILAAQSALASALALVSCASFLLVACVGLLQKSALNRHIGGIGALLSLFWLAYWVLETQLAIWVETASTVEAQYRVDFVFTAPLLYFTTIVFLSVAFEGKPREPTPPIDSGPPAPSV
jgi:hypothetical protein